MTVQNTIVKNVYVGNGSTTVFPFTFECNKAEHIQAFVKDAAGNISSTTNFKVDLEQKNLTYPNTGEPLAKGDKLIILRQLPLQQLLNLLNQGPFYAEDIEETFDEVVMMLQQMTERIGRSLAVSIDIDAENSFNTIIPLEAGKTFRVKDDGTGFEVTEDPGKVIDGAKALLKQTMEQAELAKEQAAASSQSAVSAQNAANAAEAVAPEYAKTKEVLDNIVGYTNTATEQASIATAKANAANVSATNAAQSYANADAIAGQLTEYLNTKEELTAPAVDKTLLIEGAAADAKVVGGLKSELKNDLNIIVGFKSNVAWVRGTWHNGNLLIGSAYNKRRATANKITLTNDIIISMSDYSEYLYALAYFDDNGDYVSQTDWLYGDTHISKGKTIAITLAYAVEGDHAVVDNVKNDLWLACSISSGNDMPTLDRIADAISASTKNLLTDTNPVKRTGTSVITVLDLGADTTFSNGVTFSFMANNAVTKSLTKAIVDLRKADGTHQYLTYNSMFDAHSKKFTLEPQTGRFYSNQPNYKTSITFRYVNIHYNDTISSGTLSDFMLVDGVSNGYYEDNLTGIDYIARGEAEKANSALAPYPAYWDTAMQTAVRSILDNRLTIASGDEFVFVTDQHWSANAQKSSMLIDYLAHRLSLHMVVSGGDLIQGHNASLNGAVDEIVNYYASFKEKHRILSLIGNHDPNMNNNADTSTHIPLIGLYNLMIKQEETWIDTKNSPYVNVYDNDSQKVRYIQFYYTVDSGYIQDVATALVSAMQSIPSDWTIVLLSHAYWNGANPVTTGTQFANLILDTMDGIDATVAMWLVGHVHADKDTTLTSDGGKELLIVATNTDCYKQTVHQYDMLAGTNTEQCFDVVQIDTTAKKIYMTRVGAGSDREFSY